MKKSVILILIAVYVVSIFVVGFFGLNVRIYAPNVPPTKIEITQVTYLDKVEDCMILEEENGKTYKYVPQILCQEDELTIQVRYEITPTDATNKSVSYSFDPSGYVIEENGYIVFTRPTSGVKQVGVWITLSPVDNKTISDTIYVSVKFV